MSKNDRNAVMEQKCWQTACSIGEWRHCGDVISLAKHRASLQNFDIIFFVKEVLFFKADQKFE